jgi:trimethylamine--corrinoid protein Co-methyltransferase
MKVSQKKLDALHNASMKILQKAGIRFAENEAVKIFKKHGAKVDDHLVFLEENLVQKALETVPSQFTILARNPMKNLCIGSGQPVVAPCLGSPFIANCKGEQRRATLKDYQNFCKLIQTSEAIDFNTYMVVQPHELSPDAAHLRMLYDNFILCDKALIGASISRQAARDTLAMAEIVFGDLQQPVMISPISTISPLQVSREMAEALIEFVLRRQPIMIKGGGSRGSTAPIKFADALAIQNAETIALVTLSQLIEPGTPVVYGIGLSPMDMKTGNPAYAAPEVSQSLMVEVQLARYYGIPSRCFGATSSHLPDIQAGIESAFITTSLFLSGCNFIYLVCGSLSSYNAMSYENFMIDEELLLMLKKSVHPMEFTVEDIDLEKIIKVGVGGEYLSDPETLKFCRSEIFNPVLLNRESYESWVEAGKRRLEDVAEQKLSERLDSYRKPDIDRWIENKLSHYVKKRYDR